jgi:hypothetical protein
LPGAPETRPITESIGDALARARFPHDHERFLRLDREAHPIYRAEKPPALRKVEVRPEIAYIEDGLVDLPSMSRFRHVALSSAIGSGRASPKKIEP